MGPDGFRPACGRDDRSPHRPPAAACARRFRIRPGGAARACAGSPRSGGGRQHPPPSRFFRGSIPMTRSIEFFYSFGSPYSYLAFTQLREMDVRIAYRPMRILEVMEKVGNVPTTITCAAKGRYARMDLARWCQRYGIPLNPSNMRGNDGDACSRAVLAAGSSDAADA